MKLTVPTVSDRIAQRSCGNRSGSRGWNRLFHADSYGYRPGRSAIGRVRTARQRCWAYDWVLDLDIKGILGSCAILPPDY